MGAFVQYYFTISVTPLFISVFDVLPSAGLTDGKLYSLSFISRGRYINAAMYLVCV